ncbi:MAG TPA: hypothetical protein VF261_01205, partial [Candidatus Saccharimonadales bacterium]
MPWKKPRTAELPPDAVVTPEQAAAEKAEKAKMVQAALRARGIATPLLIAALAIAAGESTLAGMRDDMRRAYLARGGDPERIPAVSPPAERPA